MPSAAKADTANGSDARKDAIRCTNALRRMESPPNDARASDLGPLCGAVAGRPWRILGFIVAVPMAPPGFPFMGGFPINGAARRGPGRPACSRGPSKDQYPLFVRTDPPQ